MDFALSDEQRLIRDTVRSFVERELQPLEPMLIDREVKGGRGVPTLEETRTLQEKGRASGLWGIDTALEFGGADLDAVTQALIYIELGKVTFDFRFGGSAWSVLYAADHVQRETYLVPTIEGLRQPCFALSEPGGSSDVANMATKAVRDGSDWIINGEKMWITGGDEADFAVVFARTDPGANHDGITAFLVDRAMGWTSTPIPLMGAHEVAALSFQDVRVPGKNVLGSVNGGLALAMQQLNRSRGYRSTGRNVGASKRLLAMAIEYAQIRSVFGRTLAERENVQWTIAEAEVAIRAAEALVLNAAWRADQGEDIRHAAAAAKLYAARTANRVVDEVMQIHGAVGYAKGIIERAYRDLRVERIYEGADEVQLSTLARGLLRGRVEIGGYATG